KTDAPEVVQLFIARGADVNVKTKSGYTPLTMAAEHGNAEVAKLLLARRADVNAKDKEGLTPLVSASRSLLIRHTLEASTPGAADMRRKFGDLDGLRDSLREVKGDFSAVAMLLVNAGA